MLREYNGDGLSMDRGDEHDDLFDLHNGDWPESADPHAALDGVSFDEQTAGAEKPVSRARSSVLEALVLVLLALVLALTLKTYVAEAYEIKGRSMAPTFHNGERVVVLKVLYGVERGSVVIFSSRDDPTKDLIKRVIGLPGEHVRIEPGRVLVDGKPLEERYIKDQAFGEYDAPVDEVLGPNEYFVLGDNRDDSHDSRRFGPVPIEALKGRVVVRWWPFHEVSTF